MKIRIRTVFFAAAIVLLLAQAGSTRQTIAATSRQLPDPASSKLVSSYGKLPLSFEPNQGQASEQVEFLSHGPGYAVFLTNGDAVLVLKGLAQEGGNPGQMAKSTVLRMKLVGANAQPQVTGLTELPGKSNYLIGKDPRKWCANIPNYAKVQYQNVYPGIDLVYYGNQRQLEYDFVVKPGATPQVIALEIAGTTGAAPAGVAENGDLLIKTEGGEVRFHKPAVYQSENRKLPAAKRQPVEGHFVLLAKNQVGFEVGLYDPAKPLYIDPVISYATYLGAGGSEAANGIAVDGDGNAYVTGVTYSVSFPVTIGSLDETCGTDGSCNFGTGNDTADAFVTKLSADGSSLVYSTFLGGSEHEVGKWIVVDSLGNAFVAGETTSDDFPTTSNAYQTTWGGGTCDINMGTIPGCRDAFFAKLNATGSALLYSTYLGGDNDDYADQTDIAIDPAGNAYIGGFTRSSNFPTVNAIQPAFHGGTCGPEGSTFPCEDGFVAKINPSAAGPASLVYSTYLGGSGQDSVGSLAVDGNGNAYVAGSTASSDFATTAGAFQTTLGGPVDAFVAKINPAGSAFTYSTLIGGTNSDWDFSVTADGDGNVYITGVTVSTDFPTTKGAFDRSCGSDGQCNGSYDAFVTKLNAEGSKLIYSTYLGGSGGDVPYSIAVDSMGIAFVTGSTDSPDFPTEDSITRFGGGTCGVDPNTYPCADAFLVKLSAGGEALIVSTYLGGSGDDNGNGIAIDSSRDAYMAGKAGSPDFPTTSGAFQENIAGPPDAFVAKLSGLAKGKEVLSPASLDFGEQVVGTTSEQMTVTVKNVGDAAVTPVPSIDATGDFQMTYTCGSSISPGTSCTIDVTFTPQETGTRTGALRAYSEEDDEWQEFFPLTGVGIAPALDVSPTSLTFEDQLVDTRSETQPVTLTNTGSSVVNFTDIQAATDFPQTTDCGNSLAAGANCTINVTFAPKATGSMTEQITVTHDAPGSPQSITISGKGTDFSILPESGTEPSPETITAGGKATYNLSIEPKDFTGDVTMGCKWSDLKPNGAACMVSPASLSLDGTHAASVAVSVTTTARSMAPIAWYPQPPVPNSYPASYLAIWMLGMGVLACLALRRRRVALMLASALFLVVAWTACGGGGTPPTSSPANGTPAGTYSLSVTATSSGVTHSTDLTLTVQ